MEMLPPHDGDHPYLEADNPMTDFWRSPAEREPLQGMRESGVRGGSSSMPYGMPGNIPSVPPDHSLRAYGYGGPLQPEAAVGTMVRSSQEGSYIGNHHPYPPDAIPSSSAVLPTYTNFFYPYCVGDSAVHHDLKLEPADGARYMTSCPENTYCPGESSGHAGYGYAEQYMPPAPLVPTVEVPTMGHNMAFSTATSPVGFRRDQDVESLRRELAGKCPRVEDLLTAITGAGDALVREHCSATSVVSSDDDNDRPAGLEKTPSLAEPDQDLRSAIVHHPYYPEMVVAHIRVFKIGAPRELRNKLDDLTNKFLRFQEGTTMRIGDDPSLDSLMRSYVDLLVKFGEDLEVPFNKFMQFKDATTKALEKICGHYVETGPDESDNYGFDVGPADGARQRDEVDVEGGEGMIHNFADIDETIIVDPSAPEAELRRALRRKYGRHIGRLKAEFSRVSRKGKLPAEARSILKDWFKRHSNWPYPSEGEKQYLQQICSLNLKQINNWFINERKRHWDCEGKCMHPNSNLYNSGRGDGHPE